MTSNIAYKTGDSDIRPWGRWQVIDVGDRHIVKRITVNPGHILSLQYHDHRNEHWIIVQGSAKITIGDEMTEQKENAHLYIPVGTRHRIGNDGPAALEFIEIQTGTFLREDDIIRLEDSYGR